MAIRKVTEDGRTLYPLDTEALEKGDYIPPEFCEEHTKCRDRNSQRYPLELEAFKERIDHDLMRLGRNWTLTCHKGGIRVLRDEDAATHNARAFKAHQRGLTRRLHKNIGVDVSVLTDESKRAHEHEVLCETGVVAAMKRVRREVALKAHKRNVPPAMLKPHAEK